jgi:hypothetical protein
MYLKQEAGAHARYNVMNKDVHEATGGLISQNISLTSNSDRLSSCDWKLPHFSLAFIPTQSQRLHHTMTSISRLGCAKLAHSSMHGPFKFPASNTNGFI